MSANLIEVGGSGEEKPKEKVKIPALVSFRCLRGWSCFLGNHRHQLQSSTRSEILLFLHILVCFRELWYYSAHITRITVVGPRDVMHQTPISTISLPNTSTIRSLQSSLASSFLWLSVVYYIATDWVISRKLVDKEWNVALNKVRGKIAAALNNIPANAEVGPLPAANCELLPVIPFCTVRKFSWLVFYSNYI